ncbi:MAG: hypothetical protein OXG53_09680 [Chloroflexi bacterium]|nr:hypothetical protein [Chloroflexota bacterium]
MVYSDPRLVRYKQARRAALRELPRRRPHKDFTGIGLAEHALLGQATLYRHCDKLDHMDEYRPEAVAQMRNDLFVMPTVAATIESRREWIQRHAVRSIAK